MSFQDARQAIRTILWVLTIATFPLSTRREDVSKTSLPFSDIGWTLGSLARVWTMITPEGADINYRETSVSCIALFLDIIRSLPALVTSTKSDSATKTKSCVFFSQVITYFVMMESLPLPAPIERSLCLALLESVFQSRNSNILHRVLYDSTIPPLLAATKNHDRRTKFTGDLQV